MKKFLISVLFFYFLILFQTSFLVHFSYFFWNNFSIPLITTAVLIIFLCFFEKPEENYGIFLAAFTGFLLDIFSSGFLGVNFLGIWVLILTALSFSIKLVLRKYVRFSLAR